MAEPTSTPEPTPPDLPNEAIPDAPFTPEELRSVAQDVSALYPPPRLGTELVLLEVNPHRAHAYWNVDVEDYQAAVASTGSATPPMMLRLHDVTGIEFDGSNAHSYFDLQVQGLQGHWYVDLWQAGRAYVAELGLRREDGGLMLLARSNPVATPAASESPRYETTAVALHPEGPRPTDLSADPNLNPETMDVETGAEVGLNPPPLHVVAPVPDAAYGAPDAGVETRPATAAFAPSAAREFPMPPLAAKPEAPAVGRQGPAALQPDSAERTDWPSAEELARHVPDTSGSVPEMPAPAANAPAVHAEAPPSHASPAPVPPAPPASLPLENYVTLSSYEHGNPQVALEVNVELHVYGRAKPGTQVSFYGQPVALRPDGSFSLRKPLPHGAVVLPLLAVDPPQPPK
ncbi:MAG TPA: DUF4912 domain-containing protein [Kiritimatiellia bacterium]|nr:DUF4912 domain-containing protein [Kiritimatiellia bacterium]